MLTVNKESKIHPEDERNKFHIRAEGYYGDMDEVACITETFDNADDAEMFHHVCKVSSYKFEDDGEREAYITNLGQDPDKFGLPLDMGSMHPSFDDITIIWVDDKGLEHDVTVDDSVTFLANLS